MKRINIFTGNYGSGKTELAINTALKLKKEHKDVILADMDIVNPYFRSSQHKDFLNKKSIKVIAPRFANTQTDIPSLPQELDLIFTGNIFSVLDCGGDPAGATALGALKPRLEETIKDTEVYFVLNACRPFQSTLKQTLEMMRVIEHVSRIKITGIINNTNLAKKTTVEELVKGQQIAIKASEIFGIPLCYISGEKRLLDEYEKLNPKNPYELFYIDIFMRPYWLNT